MESRALGFGLDAWPGMAFEVDSGGTILFANARLREITSSGSLDTFDALLDVNSVAKWRRALHQDQPTVHLELHVSIRGATTPCTFYVSPPDGDRRTVIELPRDPEAERLQAAATALNSELVNAQREISKQRAALARSVSELERSMAVEARLSAELQHHNEEIRAQNEELLGLMEELREQQDAWQLLNRQLEQRSTELEQAMSSRERFYSAMSHELRTPLTAILGYLQMLIDGIAGEMTAQQQGFIERGYRAAVHLKSLIDDVLDLAKVESGTDDLDLQQAAPAQLVREVADTVRPLAQEHGSVIEVELDHPPEQLLTDTRALRQILLNLLSNAAKFGAGQPIRIRCAGGPQLVTFEVVDSGMGIPVEQQERIFHEFVQLDPHGPQGTGLGLPISRQLAGRLGGRLEVESEPGRGATFRLSLPMAGPPTGGVDDHS